MKAFIYLYPIKPYAFLGDLSGVVNPTIEKRYKNNGYDVIVTEFLDEKNSFVAESLIDKHITANMSLSELSDKANKQYISEVKFPNLEEMFGDLNYDEVVISGFHFNSCVKMVAKYFIDRGIKVSIDLDLTEYIYEIMDSPLFNPDVFDKENFKKMVLYKLQNFMSLDEASDTFNGMINDSIYGFDINYPKYTKNIITFISRCSEDELRRFIHASFTRLHIFKYDEKVYLAVFSVLSDLLEISEPMILFTIYDVLNRLGLYDPSIIDNVYKLLGFKSDMIYIFNSNKKELVNVYYSLNKKVPIILVNPHHEIKFLNYDGEVIRCPLFACLGVSNTFKLWERENVSVNVDESEELIRSLRKLDSSYQMENVKFNFTYYNHYNA